MNNVSKIIPNKKNNKNILLIFSPNLFIKKGKSKKLIKAYLGIEEKVPVSVGNIKNPKVKKK